MARVKVDAFRKTFDEIAKAAETLSVALRTRPENFAFTNLQRSGMFLPEKAFEVQIDAKKFPSAEEIQTMLVAFHVCYRDHIDLYLNLPPALRPSVAPPRSVDFAP